MDHYNDHEILTDAQLGFRPGGALAEAIDDRCQVDAIVLDFSKAFDRVPRQRLLLKPHHYGIKGPQQI